MKCPKCNNENVEGSKFCKKCGHPLNAQNKQKMIVIGLIAVIAILSIGVLYGTGFLKGDVPLETKDFGAFKLDVPVESDFKLSDSYSKNLFVGYINYGKYDHDVLAFQVSPNMTLEIAEYTGEYVGDDGDLKIFKNSTEETFYTVYKDANTSKLLIYGSDLDLIKKMGHSYEEIDINMLSSGYASPTTPAKSTSTASTPSSISILGGSFSTGSNDADKTYARINVGTAHAGENVIVQILYSRDGNSLNNGNMVPATVHSDGYLEISSADAYKYYPDHATIKIYDSNSKLLTTKSVSLTPAAGTQTF